MIVFRVSDVFFGDIFMLLELNILEGTQHFLIILYVIYVSIALDFKPL